MSKHTPSVDLGYPTPAHGRIPSFSNIEEEAEFWDTYDITEFLGFELQSAEVTVSPELGVRLTDRLEQTDLEILAKRAHEKGTDLSTLARMWIEERLRQETQT
jgi:hypothetical protein